MQGPALARWQAASSASVTRPDVRRCTTRRCVRRAAASVGSSAAAVVDEVLDQVARSGKLLTMVSLSALVDNSYTRLMH